MLSFLFVYTSNHGFCLKKREITLFLPCKNHVIVAIFGGYFSEDYAKKNWEQHKIDLKDKQTRNDSTCTENE